MKLMFKNAVVLLGEGRYLGDGYVVTDGKFIKSVSDSRPEGASTARSTAAESS